MHLHPIHIGPQQTLTPRQAIAFSTGGFGLSAIGMIVGYELLDVPFWDATAFCGIGAFFSLTVPWVSLRLETRNRAIRAHNYFVYFVIALLIVVVIEGWGVKGGKPFPKAALVALIAAAVAAYSVMAFYAVVNFQKWLRGDFKNAKM